MVIHNNCIFIGGIVAGDNNWAQQQRMRRMAYRPYQTMGE
jgi:hypothetical protein